MALLVTIAACSTSSTPGEQPDASADGGGADARPVADGGGGTDARPDAAVDVGVDGTVTDAGEVDSAVYSECEAAADCQWGEIDHEILSLSDCICLFGCPSLALSRATVERRNAQYADLCDPYVDGEGNPCPIDDCAPPPAVECVEGQCSGPAV